MQPSKLPSCMIKAVGLCICIGFVSTFVVYWFMLQKVEHASKFTETFSRFILHTENQTEVPKASNNPEKQRKENVTTDSTPPLILLSYGFIEPFFNPKTISTHLGHKCVTTIDVGQMKASDAVVVRYNGIFKSTAVTKPKFRRPEQFFVYLSLEPPWPFYNYDFCFVEKDYFNWTMTYRRDSDVFFPYSYVDRIMTYAEDRKVKELYYAEKIVQNILARKTASSVAMAAVSRCTGGAGVLHRIEYIKQLEKSGLRIEKRGGCFQNPINERWNSDNFRAYAATFKFFLAFENGYHCRDYVTEKTWSNSLRAGTVPVILGAPKADVSKLLPAGSFVHADDFANPAELAKYLNYLDSKATAYAQYFNWRRKPPSDDILKPKDLGYNHLCNKLWEHRLYGNGSKVYHSFTDWYFKQDNLECFKIGNKSFQLAAT